MSVVLEGLIGAGKSTLGAALAQRRDMVLAPETVNAMFLERFYSDPDKYSFPFQLYMLCDRLRKASTAGPQTLQDRSVFGDWMFAMVARELGKIDDEQYAIYSSVLREAPHVIGKVLYVHSTPARCLENIHRRGRPSEQCIGLDYLRLLQKTYFHQLMLWVGTRELEPFLGPSPCLVVVDAREAFPDPEAASALLDSGARAQVTFVSRLDAAVDVQAATHFWWPCTRITDALEALQRGDPVTFVR